MALLTMAKELLRPAYWGMLRHLYPRGRAIRLNDCMTLRVDPSVNSGRGKTFNYEKQFFRQVMSTIHRGDCVFDVGANQGVYTVAMAKKTGPSGTIHAFEAAPAAIDVLIRQIQNNGVEQNVILQQGLVSNNDGEFHTLHAAPTAAGWVSGVYKGPGTYPMKVISVTLDHYASIHDVTPATIKIDVEGMEFDVLRGCERILREGCPTVFCAMHPEILKGRDQSVTTILSWMKERGYVARNLQHVAPKDMDTEVIFTKKRAPSDG